VKSQPATARGYFAIGIEGASKAVNLGNLLRSAHAFGASFVFTVGAEARVMDTIADTSKASSHLPLYHWQSIDELSASSSSTRRWSCLFRSPGTGGLCARP
jgi:tRNA G18 (ribose-2'-O)-methylase SpoU